jgi:hypothetical protein
MAEFDEKKQERGAIEVDLIRRYIEDGIEYCEVAIGITKNGETIYGPPFISKYYKHGRIETCVWNPTVSECKECTIFLEQHLYWGPNELFKTIEYPMMADETMATLHIETNETEFVSELIVYCVDMKK